MDPKKIIVAVAGAGMVALIVTVAVMAYSAWVLFAS